MKRTFNSFRYSGTPGDERAMLAATGLASIANEEEIRAIIDVVTLLHRFGGEFVISSYRAPFVDVPLVEEGEVVYGPEGEPIVRRQRANPDTPGAIYDTYGLLYHYEHVAKATKVATDAPVEDDLGELDEFLPLVAEANEDSDGRPVDPARVAADLDGAAAPAG